ncbi:MAG: phenylacetate--CoA ligase family protein [Candidatus Cloacimonadota bacterium]|nr:MAG: phenylacetate--CoA ligase family protein [Candidatus Cloacimonadota bacterium]
MVFRSLLDLYRLRRNQWLKLSELEKIQLRKLRRIIKHAYENVPYYRKLFDLAGIRPEDIKTARDLTKIPITTRLQLQQLPPEEIVAKGVDLNNCKKITTAGSSGIPLVVFLSDKDSNFYDMVWARASLANGKRLWDSTAYLKFHFPPKFCFERLGIWKKEIISVLDNPEKQIETLRRVRPDVIRGNAFGLVNLAKIIKQKGVGGMNPRLVFSMGSVLDHQSRELIESAFGAEVFDFYGTTEVGCIAWECSEKRGFHINIDTVVVELIKKARVAGPGEMGKIICTGLHSFTMPFIRYDTGDVGIANHEKCPCGRELPLLESIKGRADDFFISANGTLYSPSVIVNQIKLISGISQFRIIQRSLKDITAQVVPGKDFSQHTSKKIKETIGNIMGKDPSIEVEVLGVIPLDPSGKIRSLISKVKKEF